MKSNKLPEIGVRYKVREDVESYIIKVDSIQIENSGTWINRLNFFGENLDRISLGEFWHTYEPIPKEQDHNEDKLDKVKEIKLMNFETEEDFMNHTMRNKVQNAHEDLRNELMYGDRFYDDLLPKAQNLINALDDMGKKDDNLPMKEEPKSIWKDVSEFDELNALIHEQGFSVELMIYLQFILNQQEQNTKDIAELKQLIKGE